MRLTNLPILHTVQTEASRFWLYALFVSILLTLYDLFYLSPSTVSNTIKPPSSSTTDEKSTSPPTPSEGLKQRQIEASRKEAEVYRRQRTLLIVDLIIDACDVPIPGTAVGWIVLDPVMVGTAMAVSSLLAGGRIWRRVNPVVIKAGQAETGQVTGDPGRGRRGKDRSVGVKKDL